jgi:hypothetical protein
LWGLKSERREERGRWKRDESSSRHLFLQKTALKQSRPCLTTGMLATRQSRNSGNKKDSNSVSRELVSCSLNGDMRAYCIYTPFQLHTACFKKSFTTLKDYVNVFGRHVTPSFTLQCDLHW